MDETRQQEHQKGLKKQAILGYGFTTVVSFGLAMGFHVFKIDAPIELFLWIMTVVAYLRFQYELHKREDAQS